MNLYFFLDFFKIKYDVVNKKMKKKPSQRHISKSAELDGGRGFSGKKKIYEDGN